jgi:hypothetical protein
LLFQPRGFNNAANILPTLKKGLLAMLRNIKFRERQRPPCARALPVTT